MILSPLCRLIIVRISRPDFSIYRINLCQLCMDIYRKARLQYHAERTARVWLIPIPDVALQRWTFVVLKSGSDSK